MFANKASLKVEMRMILATTFIINIRDHKKCVSLCGLRKPQEEICRE
jgi:hypothetical protein